MIEITKTPPPVQLHRWFVADVTKERCLWPSLKRTRWHAIITQYVAPAVCLHHAVSQRHQEGEQGPIWASMITLRIYLFALLMPDLFYLSTGWAKSIYCCC